MYESLLMGLYTADQMRKVDGTAIDGIGIPGSHLMERAGLAVAAELLERYEPEEVVVFAGKGNNGGDGFVVARELFNAGVEVSVFTLAPAGEYKGDAKLNLEILERLGVDVREGFEKDGAPTEDAMVAVELADVIVDADLRDGVHGRGEGRRGRRDRAHERGPGRGREHRHRERGRRRQGDRERAGRAGRRDRRPARAQGGSLRDPRGRVLGRGRRRAHRHPAALRPRARRLAAHPRRACSRSSGPRARSTTSARSARCSSSAARPA